MKVGLIGLGRMGEGMSRRMLKQGIEVYGYPSLKLRKGKRSSKEWVHYRCCRFFGTNLFK